MAKLTLLEEDFKSFKLRDFPYEPFLGAMGEYHYRPNPWYDGGWYDPTPLMGSGGVKTWMIVEQDGGKCLEYSAALRKRFDLLVLLANGEQDWSDYTVSCQMRLLLSSSIAGLVFRYQNSLCFYMLRFNGGKLELLKRNQQGVTVLAGKEYAYNSDQAYQLKVACQGSQITCWVNDVQEFAVEDTTYAAGRIAIGTMAVAQFTNITVEMDSAVHAELIAVRRANAIALAQEQANYPQPRLWKRINLQDFGAGRSVRFGHLLGNKQTQLVIAQCQRRILRDAFAQISCLTAIDLDGNVLWQVGEPNPEHAFLTADMPFQIGDIDGDGHDEVIYARDFKIFVLDGATGQVKKWAHTPLMDRPDYPFDRLNVDNIRLCDFSGKGRATDLLIKDRYKQVWALNSDLEVMWTHVAAINTGHFGYSKDINGDGREELYIGYDLVSADGAKIWSLAVPTDHTDEIVIGKIDPEKEDLIGIVSGSEGFMLADLQGNILVKEIIGHAQRISVGNFRSDLPGLQICVSTYWDNQGIIYLYDCKGKLLWSDEPSTNGNVITPINWTGDGRDLILLNANVKLGGMIDGYNRRVVTFPDDGHPELCAEAIDLTGDCRDEIVVWDEKMMYIYTQDDVIEGREVDCPEKYPHYNASNYRGEYAYRKTLKKDS